MLMKNNEFDIIAFLILLPFPVAMAFALVY
jgi:hypothetical protein